MEHSIFRTLKLGYRVFNDDVTIYTDPKQWWRIRNFVLTSGAYRKHVSEPKRKRFAAVASSHSRTLGHSGPIGYQRSEHLVGNYPDHGFPAVK